MGEGRERGEREKQRARKIHIYGVQREAESKRKRWVGEKTRKKAGRVAPFKGKGTAHVHRDHMAGQDTA